VDQLWISIGHRPDIFPCGVLLYKMLGGIRVFTGEGLPRQIPDKVKEGISIGLVVLNQTCLLTVCLNFDTLPPWIGGHGINLRAHFITQLS